MKKKRKIAHSIKNKKNWLPCKLVLSEGSYSWCIDISRTHSTICAADNSAQTKIFLRTKDRVHLSLVINIHTSLRYEKKTTLQSSSTRHAKLNSPIFHGSAAVKPIVRQSITVKNRRGVIQGARRQTMSC